MDKYELLICEDLSLKPSTAEKVKFEHPPLGKVFNKDWIKKIKKKDFWGG